MIGTPRLRASCSWCSMRGLFDADVLAEEEDAVGAVEIVERDGADRHADASAAAPTEVRLVAHVRAVRQVVVAVHAREQLRTCRTSPARRGPRRRRRPTCGSSACSSRADLGEGLVPVDAARSCRSRRPSAADGSGGPASSRSWSVQVASSVTVCSAKKSGADPVRRSSSHSRRLGAVLAKLEGMRLGGLRPGAADAHEAARACSAPTTAHCR